MNEVHLPKRDRNWDHVFFFYLITHTNYRLKMLRVQVHWMFTGVQANEQKITEYAFPISGQHSQNWK